MSPGSEEWILTIDPYVQINGKHPIFTILVAIFGKNDSQERPPLSWPLFHLSQRFHRCHKIFYILEIASFHR